MCRDILAAEPRQAAALHVLGLIAAARGVAADAVDFFAQVIEIEPDNGAAFANHGTALQALKQWAAALQSFDAAIALRPGYPIAYNNRGNVLCELKRFDEAVESFERAIAIDPHFAVAWLNRGNALRALKRWEPALASYDRALGIEPCLTAIWVNRAAVLGELDRPDEALASLARALGADGGASDADIYVNRGNLERDHGQPVAAVASYQRAIELRPEFADAHVNLSMALLGAGDFERGWHEYEWRWRCRDLLGGASCRELSQPPWLGATPIAGRRLLLCCEQGLGDTLQFARYAPMLAAAGAYVILEVQPALASLFERASGVGEVLTAGSPAPPFDEYCPLLSLPLAASTRLDTIPPPLRPVVDPVRVALWRTRLEPRERPIVGLVWRGNARHRDDHRRSSALRDWLDILPPGCRYVSLQKTLEAGERQLIASRPRVASGSQIAGGAPLETLADELDFRDTAALCECLDLVISVDTSIAHLSASLGRATWIVLAHKADWRWLTDREDSPWYPSVRLFRQSSRGPWREVLDRVATALLATFGFQDRA